jgi:hypothetical protein
MLQSLLLTGLGGLLGIAGTLLASQWQARNARQVRSEQYVREDRYRLASERIEAYAAFYKSAGKARGIMWKKSHGENLADDSNSMLEVRNNVWESYTIIGLIGDNSTERRAAAILEYVTAVSHDQAKFAPGKWSELMKAYIRSARAELTLVSGSAEGVSWSKPSTVAAKGKEELSSSVDS